MLTALNVLLVDDEQLILELLTETLVDRGHRVTAVADPRAALEAVATGTFDVALLDQHLGASRGLDLMRELAAHDPRMRFLIMTGGVTPDLVAEASSAGAAVLSKPIFGDELVRSLERLAATQPGGKGMNVR